MIGPQGEKFFLVGQDRPGDLHQGFTPLGDALLHPLRLAQLGGQVLTDLRGFRILAHLPVIAVDADARIHGFV